jgi:predicted GNAT superfamily acetyltransferase
MSFAARVGKRPAMSEIRNLCPEDFAWVLGLNTEVEAETSPLDASALAAMTKEALLAAGIEERAFVLAFREGAEYASPNYKWFAARFATFAYVDRIVVVAHARGQGLGGKLYEHLFKLCAQRALPFVGCEVNVDPPNPGSDKFHAALGFVELGQARLKNGKFVRYLRREL